MNKRERNMIIVTVSVVALLLFYNFFLADRLDSAMSTGGGEAELAGAQQTFTRYLKTLKDGRSINKDYKSIGFNLPEQTPGQDPGATFSNQLFTLLTTQLGVPNPNIGKASYSDISKSVDDYYFVDIDVSVNGPYVKLAKLLEDMERQGLLIKKFKLDQSRDSQDGGDTKLQVTISRLVKHDKDSRARLKRMNWRRS